MSISWMLGLPGWATNLPNFFSSYRPSLLFYFLGHTFLKKFYLFILERGREGEREGEKPQGAVASHVPLGGDLACNPGMCPDWDSNQWSFGSQTGAQSIELHQPGWGKLSLILLFYFNDHTSLKKFFLIYLLIVKLIILLNIKSSFPFFMASYRISFNGRDIFSVSLRVVTVGLGAFVCYCCVFFSCSPYCFCLLRALFVLLSAFHREDFPQMSGGPWPPIRS